MPSAVGNSKPRGRGRMERLPGGNLPRSGGTPAPGRNSRGGGRVNPQGVGMMNPPGQGPAGGGQPQGGRNSNGQGGGNKAGVGGAALPGPGGRQLEAKVQSGAITQEQAQRTMQQRQTLAKALGPNWRDKLSVGGQSFAQVNKQLKANPGNAKLAAIRQKLVANRSKVLAGARSKGQGGGGTEAPEPAGKRRRKQPAGVE